MIKISENVLSNDLSPYLKQHKDNSYFIQKEIAS